MQPDFLDELDDLYPDPDRTPLIQWLRETSTHPLDGFPQTGSTAFFGTGKDTDFLVCIDWIPEELRHLIPTPHFLEYSEGFVSMKDPNHPWGNADYIIADKPRTEEFLFATKHFCSMRHDPKVKPETWEKLKHDKDLRVAVFQALRHAFPETTLNY